MLTEIFWTAVTSILTEILTKILWALLFIACFAFLTWGAEGNERRRKEALWRRRSSEEYQKAVDRRRKEATAELERQMPGRFFRSVDVGGLRTAVYNAREAGVARELVQTAEDALREADG